MEHFTYIKNPWYVLYGAMFGLLHILLIWFGLTNEGIYVIPNNPFFNISNSVPDDILMILWDRGGIYNIL